MSPWAIVWRLLILVNLILHDLCHVKRNDWFLFFEKCEIERRF